jgi:hypothetical protein
MAGAAAAEVLGMFAKSAWGQTVTHWPSPEEAKQIAQEAYVYAFPIVQNYLSIYQLALDPKGRQYKGPPNQTVTKLPKH